MWQRIGEACGLWPNRARLGRAALLEISVDILPDERSRSMAQSLVGRRSTQKPLILGIPSNDAVVSCISGPAISKVDGAATFATANHPPASVAGELRLRIAAPKGGA
jgi:hypothetical protein